MLVKNISLGLLALLVNSCTSNANQLTPASPTPWILTATLSPTLLLQPTESPLPFPPTPALPPVEGITSTQVNVRAEPSTGSTVLGIIPPDMRVEIVGRDPGGSWWQILYPQGTQERGWVTAQFVRTVSTPEVPVIGGGANSNNENVAVIQQQLNVRSGPGADFNSLGTLNPQDVVSLIGKDANGGWLQIDFTSGPEGKGWISAAFVQAQGVENLPIIAESGAVVGTGTPTEVPLTPTPTLLPAPVDHDSAQSPAININLSSTGSQSFQYSSDVSFPDGDTEDWIQFTPFAHRMRIALECKGNGAVVLEVLQNGSAVQPMKCGENSVINVTAGNPYTIHIRSDSSNGLGYTLYTLWVESVR